MNSFKPLARRCATLLACALALTSCGGGGGGGGGGQAPSYSIAATAGAYWVGSTGARWTYRLVEHGAASGITKTVVDMGTQTLGTGTTARRFDHSWSLYGPQAETEYRYYDGAAIRRIDAQLIGTGAPAALVDYADVPAPLSRGTRYVLADVSEPINANGDGIADTLRLQVSVSLEVDPTLTVPAGDFINVLRATQEAVATVTLGGSGQSASATSTLTTWYATGVGVVKRQFVDPNYSAPYDTSTEELVGVSVPGLRAGTVVDVAALDGLGWGATSAAPAGSTAAAGGQRVLVASPSEAGTIEGALLTSDGSAVWRGTLLGEASTLFGHPSIAFDGTDFHVVAVAVGSGGQALVGQRVAVDGSLRDGPSGAVLATDIADPTQSLMQPRAAAGAGRLLVSWGRYDPTLLPTGGWVIEGRLYDAARVPVGATFLLGDGVPGAAIARDDQFLVVNDGRDVQAVALYGWAIASNGVPVSSVPILLAEDTTAKAMVRLQASAGETWLSFARWTAGQQLGSTSFDLRAARLGRDAVLLDGNWSVPGTSLGQQPSGRTAAAVGIDETQALLAWSEGYRELGSRQGDRAVLTGAASWPATTTPIVPDALPGQPATDARTLAFALDTGPAFMVGWLVNAQSSGGGADRVAATWIFPRHVAH